MPPPQKVSITGPIVNGAPGRSFSTPTARVIACIIDDRFQGFFLLHDSREIPLRFDHATAEKIFFREDGLLYLVHIASRPFLAGPPTFFELFAWTSFEAYLKEALTEL